MSLEAAKQFLQKVEADPALRQKLDEAQGDPQTAIKLGAEMDLSFTVEDLEVAQDEVYGELSDEDLEAAAGGQGGKLPPISFPT